jgi:hypothetical protein
MPTVFRPGNSSSARAHSRRDEMDAHRREAENPAALRDSPKPVRSQRPDYPFAAEPATRSSGVRQLVLAESGHAIRAGHVNACRAKGTRRGASSPRCSQRWASATTSGPSPYARIGCSRRAPGDRASAAWTRYPRKTKGLVGAGHLHVLGPREGTQCVSLDAPAPGHIRQRTLVVPHVRVQSTRLLARCSHARERVLRRLVAPPFPPMRP